jgi:protoporphyrinogen oxidase
MKHLDSAFYYPNRGISMIPDQLAEYCGLNNIFLNSKITRIIHNKKRIQKIEINNERKVDVQEIVNTLPLPLFLRMLKPQPPSNILKTVENLRYRDMLLVALFINRDSVTASASIHFPDITYPFTRIHESKNRSISMSPKGKTSLVLELPSQRGDPLWCLPDDQIIRLVSSHLVKIGFISANEVEKGLVKRLLYVYPVLDIGYRRKIQTIFSYLKTFENLKLTGRSGAFQYLSIHNIMKSSKKLIHHYIPH